MVQSCGNLSIGLQLSLQNTAGIDLIPVISDVEPIQNKDKDYVLKHKPDSFMKANKRPELSTSWWKIHWNGLACKTNIQLQKGVLNFYDAEDVSRQCQGHYEVILWQCVLQVQVMSAKDVYFRTKTRRCEKLYGCSHVWWSGKFFSVLLVGLGLWMDYCDVLFPFTLLGRNEQCSVKRLNRWNCTLPRDWKSIECI